MLIEDDEYRLSACDLQKVLQKSKWFANIYDNNIFTADFLSEKTQQPRFNLH